MEKIKQETVRLYVVGEEKIRYEVCQAVLGLKTPVKLLGYINNRDIRALKPALSKRSPDVVLAIFKKLEMHLLKEFEQIRTDYPKIGVILLLDSCGAQDIELLRRLALIKGTGGTALFLKQPEDKMDWLHSVITAVSQGQFIVDTPLAAFMFAGKPGDTFLKQFTPRELEILNLLADGYTNTAIATTLYIDIKTVEHHLNNLYSKLKADHEFHDKHLRVSVAKLFLEAVGESGREENLIVRSSVNWK